jgi:pimeloyl-ACP methyl ester carboxylesterase
VLASPVVRGIISLCTRTRRRVNGPVGNNGCERAVAVRAMCAALLVTAAACSGDDQAEPSTTASVPTTTASSVLDTALTTLPATTAVSSSMPRESWFTPGLRERRCPRGHPDNAECLTFTVAADRDDPDSSTIELPVVVLRATGAAPVSDALVIPAGGPGYPGADALGWADSPFNERRDIVLYDQRGTGAAVPGLECPARDEAFVTALQTDRSYDEERDAMSMALDDCLAALDADGVEVSDYHSEASAADLDELRQALGYRQWNLLGISYGGRLALATMRSYPDGVRAAILDSVYDVTYGGLAATLDGIERAFRRLADGCTADPACAAAHGDLDAKYERLRERYNADPVVVDVDLAEGNGARRFVITGDDMMAGLFNALYDTALIPLLPSFIDALVAGNTSIIPALVQRGVPFATGAADAMAVAVNCADNAGLDTTAADAAAYDQPGRLGLVAGLTGVCPPDWPATPGEFNTPVMSEIPSLVLAGSYDPITPPAGTRRVAGRLSNSTFLLVDPVGHGVTGFNRCIEQIELAFLDDPTAPLDTRCAASIPPPDFQ